MFEFDFEDLPAEPGANGGLSELPVAGTSTASFRSIRTAMRHVPELQLEVVTLGGGIVASLKLPPSTTAAGVKERLEKIVCMRAAEQRLAIGAHVFDGSDRLEAYIPEVGNAIQVALVHVPAARRVVVSGGRDASLRLWNLDHGDTFRELPTKGVAITCLSAVWSERRALSGGSDSLLRLWDLESGKVLHELRGHGAAVTCLAANWSWQRAISGDEEGALILWDLERCAMVQQMPGHNASVLCVDLSMEGNCAVTGSADNTLRLWVIDTNEVFLEFQSFTPANCIAANLTKQPPIGVTGNFTIVRFWSLNQWPVQWDFPVHTAAVTCVVVHWESLYMVSGSADTTLVCGRMNLNSNKVEELKALRGHSSSVTCLAVDWDRRRAVSGSEDGSLRFWDLGRGVCLQELVGHRVAVLCVALELEDSPETSASQVDIARVEELMRARREAGVAEQVKALDDLALGKPVQASSSRREEGPPQCAVDGKPGTRWSSEYSDGQWLMVDLEGLYELSHVEIRWEDAFAESYTLHVSSEGSMWTTVASERGQEGWVVTKVPAKSFARWVRVYGQKRATRFGFSIWDVKVYGVPRSQSSRVMA